MLTLLSGVRKDGGGPLQTSLTDLKPPAAPNHSKRIADVHGESATLQLFCMVIDTKL